MKSNITEEEAALFRAAVKDVKPLRRTQRVTFKTAAGLKSRLKKDRPVFAEEEALKDDLSDHLKEVVTGEQRLFYARHDLPHKLLRDLKQGKIKQSVIVDLHGYTVSEARKIVVQTLDACLKQQVRCLRIIHGKGRMQRHDQPILKNQINNWLQQRQDVLAFCSAKPQDGGAGAVYVLLKASKNYF